MNEINVSKDPNIVPSLCSELTDLKISRFFRIPIFNILFKKIKFLINF